MLKKFENNPKVIERRKRVIKRLEIQLDVGFKSLKGEPKPDDLLKIDEQGRPIGTILNEGDRKRINKELETLKLRL